MESVSTKFHIRKQAFAELPEDAGPDEVQVHPPEVGTHVYSDNLPEYRYRYASYQEKQFKEQVSYLERLLSLCKDRGIKMILVNMPLTKDNVDLMPPGFYEHYKGTMTRLCGQYQAQMIDLNGTDEFPKKYFADSAHLNSKGGERFFEVLSERLLNDSQVASTMRSIAPPAQ